MPTRSQPKFPAKYGNRRSASRHETVASQPSTGYGTLMLASAPGGKPDLLALYPASAPQMPSDLYSVPGGKFLDTNPCLDRQSEKRRRGSSTTSLDPCLAVDSG